MSDQNLRMDEESDSDDCICPKCGHAYHVESEDYSMSPRVEECGECGYKYHTWQTFSVTTRTRPDCELNDTPHDWVHRAAGAREYWQCSTCSRLVVSNPGAEAMSDDTSDLCDPHDLHLPRADYEAARGKVIECLKTVWDVDTVDIELYPNRGYEDGIWWTWWVEGDENTSYIHEDGRIECIGVNVPENEEDDQ